MLTAVLLRYGNLLYWLLDRFFLGPVLLRPTDWVLDRITLLYRWSGQDDMLIGTPVSGRSRTELEPLIGYFSNSVVLRLSLSGDPTFRELLQQTKEVALTAYSHQHLPFEKLVTEMQPLDVFYPAETYHQNYYQSHPGQPYCQVVVAPKVAKARQHFVAMLKK